MDQIPIDNSTYFNYQPFPKEARVNLSSMKRSSSLIPTKFEEILKMGASRLDLEVGYLTRMKQNELEVISIFSSFENPIKPGAHTPTEGTLCEKTILQNRTFSHPDVKQSQFSENPFSRTLRIGSYIGAPLRAAGKCFGTLGFCSRNKVAPFGAQTHSTVELIAKWCESEIRFTHTQRESQFFFDLSIDMFCTATLEGQFLSVNPAFTRILGYSREEFEGQSALNFIHPEDKETTIKELRKLEQGIDTAYFENRYISKSGKTHYIAWTCPAPLPNSNRLYAVGRDITSLKEAEKETREKNEQLVHMSRVKTLGEMASYLAHEINQPLYSISNFIGGSLHHLKKEGFTEKTLDALTKAKSECNRAGKILTNISRFVSKSSPTKQPSNLNDIILNSVELLKFEANQKNIAIETQLYQELDRINIENTQIQQVIFNLVRNAFDAFDYKKEDRSPLKNWEKPIVLIESLQSKNFVECRVSDNGSGIRLPGNQNIFVPFVTTKTKGIGLGLSICKTILEAHEGQIGVLNGGTIEGLKTTLFFRIPREGITN